MPLHDKAMDSAAYSYGWEGRTWRTHVDTSNGGCVVRTKALSLVRAVRRAALDFPSWVLRNNKGTLILWEGASVLMCEAAQNLLVGETGLITLAHRLKEP